MINDLPVFCTNRACSWQGPLDQSRDHLEECKFSSENLPPWMNKYLESCELELQRNEEEIENNLEEDRDVLREELDDPLTVRLFKKS